MFNQSLSQKLILNLETILINICLVSFLIIYSLIKIMDL